MTRMRLAITILALLNLYPCGFAHAQIDGPDESGRRSKWESYRSQLRPEEVPPITQDFGWSATHHAGGQSAGEIGGRIQRSLKRCRYSMRLSETLTLDKEVVAQGRLAVTGDEGSSGALIGFFHASSEGWRTPNSLAFRVDGNSGKYWLFFEYGTRNGKTAGKGVFEGERYQTTNTKPFAADGTAHAWRLRYDPNAGDHGTLNFQVDGQEHTIALTEDTREDGALFNRFGIWNQQTTGNGLELWIDDLFVQGKPVSFDEDPMWVAENSRASFQPAAVRPFHDYGYRTETKSIGGVIWRDEAPSYCAKPIANLTLEQPLKASGRIRLNQAAADSGLYLGWFDSGTKRNNRHAEHERRQRNYLAVHIEGPSRIGHYFRPGYGTRTGRGRNAESGPVLLPDGEWHHWSIDYQPEKRRIVATLGEDSVSLDLNEEDLADGAAFDRFGVFNHQSGGWHLDFEIDQLEFTGGESADAFTMIVLPDTQGYADTRHRETQKHWPDIGDQRACFFRQTEWIKNNKRKRRIALAVHVGDITQTDHHDEWKIADTAFKTIDPHVPYFLCSGNHDMGYSPDLRKTGQSRASQFSACFPPSRFTENPLYDSHFGAEKHRHFREAGKTENYYLYFHAGGMKFLVLTLEFKPRDEPLAWANWVAEQHPDHRLIVVTHAYLTKKGQRTPSDGYPVKGNSGQAIWEKFISRHKNIFLVLSGHAGESRLTSKGRHGNTVHQIQSDYWYWDLPRIKAGSGFLRILTFHPGQERIEVETYSPVLDEFLDRPSSKFSLPFAMGDASSRVSK